MGTGQYSQVLGSIGIGGISFVVLTPNAIPVRHRHSDSCNRLSGHRADMLLGLLMVIATLYTSIGIGIGYWYH